MTHHRQVTTDAGEQSIGFTREFDARTGGGWSYVVSGPDGEWAFHGTFHEVTASSRLVQTFESRAIPATPRWRC